MFGGLYIEMAAFYTLGTCLKESGWTSAIVQAKIAMPGPADSFIKAAHRIKTRHAHQITAVILSILQHKAYQTYIDNVAEEESELEFEAWEKQCIAESQYFQYWCLTLKLQF